MLATVEEVLVEIVYFRRNTPEQRCAERGLQTGLEALCLAFCKLDIAIYKSFSFIWLEVYIYSIEITDAVEACILGLYLAVVVQVPGLEYVEIAQGLSLNLRSSG